MIEKKRSYCIVYFDIVQELSAWEAVVYGAIEFILSKTNGTGEISNQKLIDMCGTNRKSLSRYIENLINAGYIEKREGNGRGNISVYYITKKGDKMTTFINEKGGQNDTKRGTNCPIKGDRLTTLNNNNMININKESGDDTRETCTPPLSNTTPQNFENMEDFNLWFELFTGGSEWQHEKENCERVWYGMTQQWRDNLVQMAQNGLRWRKRENDNPYWYLKNYNGEVAQVELPYFRQGTKKFEEWYMNNRLTRTKMVLMRYREPGDRDDAPTLAYCLATDMQTMMDAGAEFVGNVN